MTDLTTFLIARYEELAQDRDALASALSQAKAELVKWHQVERRAKANEDALRERQAGDRKLAAFYEAADALRKAIADGGIRNKRLLDATLKMSEAMNAAHDYCDQIPF